MIIEPRMRGFICLTAHPTGCEQNIKNQIAYIKSKGHIEGAKRVLVIGASTGFGLASRITSAFGCDASTIGVFFEKPASQGKTASPGWYNSAAFENEAKKAGLYAKSINGDAFSNDVKQQTINLIKKI
ncbi:trans-2-enoyl-CoA reductase (NAD(+)) [Flavobacterium psychrophilum]|nr:trans-2-enoyl-CoA reductase (NAD(+)) [Flavobacterium psychrophilum]